jgi:serine/threonine-protein kinase mTOR
MGQGGSNEFLDHIFQAIRDPQPIVRACATDSLSQCLKILVERQHPSLTGLLCQVHFNVMEGLQEETSKKRPWSVVSAAEAAQHGSLLVVSTMLAYTRDFMIPRFEEVCRAVLRFTNHPKYLIRLEVVRLLPRLARRCPRVFARRYLEDGLVFLMRSADTPPGPRVGVDLRPSSYTALGQLIVAMTDEDTGVVLGGSKLPTIKIVADPTDPDGIGQIVELHECGIIYKKLSDIFLLVRKGLRPPQKGFDGNTVKPALHCAARLVEALGDLALPYIFDLIDDMFRAGLSHDLIQCLQSIAECVPAQQNNIEERMLRGVSMCLAGRGNVYDPLESFKLSVFQAGGQSLARSIIFRAQFRSKPHDFVFDPVSGGFYAHADTGTENPMISINMSTDQKVVRDLVLGLETLSSFGGTMGKVATSGGIVPLLPFVKDVASQYLSHPSFEVRRASALTCCSLLIPHGTPVGKQIGSYSGVFVEFVLKKLVQTAISDPSPGVRLCVVRALDMRYDTYLCQLHHLQELFLLLQDESLATRAAGLSLLGRLAAKNPGPVLPVLRKLLIDIMMELQCGVGTGRVREEATRLLVVFLRAKPLQRLVPPVLPTLVATLPLNKAAPPRLASASLEALGELAQATGRGLKPWLKDVVPHVLEIMEDRSSASKQRTGLRTLGQIAGSTGYVIRPYLDYPQLLSQATEILPATKRAPWSLRREVIRTLGILGALDPDRYQDVASKRSKGGAVGGAYFEVDLIDDIAKKTSRSLIPTPSRPLKSASSESKHSGNSLRGIEAGVEDDDDQPAYLFMYEQYAMVAQPVSNLPPAKRMTPSEDDFYPTVAIQALMRIFRDPALSVHHGMVVQAVMFIFMSLGTKCVPYLGKVVPHMINAVRTCGPSNLRESLLMQLAVLSSIVREHLRPFVADIFDVVEQFWSTHHLSTLFNLISNLAVGSPDEFRRFAPRLIQRLLSSLDELQLADWSAGETRPVLGRGRAESARARLILKIVCSLRMVLREYLGIIVPALLKLADSLASLSLNEQSDIPEATLTELSVLVYRAVSSLLETLKTTSDPVALLYLADERLRTGRTSENGLPSRVVQPLVRTFLDKPPKSPSVGLAMVETLCICVTQIGAVKWSNLYDEVVRDAIAKWQATFPLPTSGETPSSSFRVDDRIISCLELYDECVEAIMRPPLEIIGPVALQRASSVREGIQIGGFEAIPFDNTNELFEQALAPTSQVGPSAANQQKVNQSKLQRVWDVSQRASRDDWDEWMRRLGIQLLREAPSPALRATASLAHAYQPLARELFSAAFASCWKDLSEPYRVNLVHALKTAFVADVSPEILQVLLNLAEFMEHDPSGGLPIEIPILADLALKCRAYAKALHYKEREYNTGPTTACVESLISINGKLDLPGKSDCQKSVVYSFCFRTHLNPFLNFYDPIRGCAGNFEGR